MQMKPPRQFARRGQALARCQVVAQNAQHNLRHQLFSDRNLTAVGKPELHGATMISAGFPVCMAIAALPSPAV
jgi:hypothetical protein